MVSILYKWLLDDELTQIDDLFQDLEDEDEQDDDGAEISVCEFSNLQFLKMLTDNLPTEPSENEEPHNKGGL